MAKQSRDVTIAFAGSGASTLENTKALLNDFFGLGPEDADGFPKVPEDLNLRVILPVSDTHVSDSLMTVFDWTEYADVAYEVVVADDVDEKSKDVKALLKYAEERSSAVKNVNAEVIEALKSDQKEGREVHLFLFWGEEGDEHSEILLDLASSAEIKTKDVTAGLDDLSFDEPEPEPEPDPEPDPEPEPEERPRRGRRRTQEPETKALEDEPEPEPEKEEPKPRPTRGKARQTEPEPPTLNESVKKIEEGLAKVEEKSTLDEEISTARRKAAREAAVDEEANARFKTASKDLGQVDVAMKAITVKQNAKLRDVSPDIYNRVAYHPATAETAPLHEAIRKATLEYLHLLDGLLPDGREKSLAFTQAEQAMFWANAAVARNLAKPAEEQPTESVFDRLGVGTQEAPETPSRGRGRPRNDGQPTRTRTAQERAVTEIWDEEEEAWKPKGRGRIPKGAKTRLVDPKTGDVVDE